MNFYAGYLTAAQFYTGTTDSMSYSVAINPVSSDGVINAAEKNGASGVTIAGTVSAGVTSVVLNFSSGLSHVVTDIVGTTWKYKLDSIPGDFDGMGQGTEVLTATATFGTGLSAVTASASRTIFVDTLQPNIAITNDGPGWTTNATGLVTYTFTFSEPVTGFTAADIMVTGGSQRTFSTLNPFTYTLAVLPTAGTSSGNLTVSVAGGKAADAAGNGRSKSTRLNSSHQ